MASALENRRFTILAIKNNSSGTKCLDADDSAWGFINACKEGKHRLLNFNQITKKEDSQQSEEPDASKETAKRHSENAEAQVVGSRSKQIKKWYPYFKFCFGSWIDKITSPSSPRKVYVYFKCPNCAVGSKFDKHCR